MSQTAYKQGMLAWDWPTNYVISSGAFLLKVRFWHYNKDVAAEEIHEDEEKSKLQVNYYPDIRLTECMEEVVWLGKGFVLDIVHSNIPDISSGNMRLARKMNSMSKFLAISSTHSIFKL